MAVYLIEDSKGNKTLVETRTKAGAINYVSRDEYKATSLNTTELVKHIRSGMEVQTVGGDEESAEEESAPLIDTMKKGKEEVAAPKVAKKAAQIINL